MTYLNKKGYSLAELIVVIAIIGIMFTISLSFYKHNSMLGFINNDAYSIKTNIIKAQNMTLSGDSQTKYSDNINFGVYLLVGNKFFYLYKDLNSNNVFDTGENIETISLNNSSINSLSSGSSMNLIFKTNNDVYLNAVKTTSTSISISLIYKTASKNIYINSLIKTINIQ